MQNSEPLWRIIMDGKATLLELQTVYSLRDAVRLYTAIDIGSTINNVLYEVKKKE